MFSIFPLCVFLLLFNVHLRRSIVMVFDCLIFDKGNKKGVASRYFLWLVIGYGFGKLCLTMLCYSPFSYLFFGYYYEPRTIGCICVFYMWLANAVNILYLLPCDCYYDHYEFNAICLGLNCGICYAHCFHQLLMIQHFTIINDLASFFLFRM